MGNFIIIIYCIYFWADLGIVEKNFKFLVRKLFKKKIKIANF